MNENHMLDPLRVSDAIYFVSEVTEIASLGENIPLGGLSCVMWLCHNKLINVMNEIQSLKEKAEQDKVKTKPIASVSK